MNIVSSHSMVVWYAHVHTGVSPRMSSMSLHLTYDGRMQAVSIWLIQVSASFSVLVQYLISVRFHVY